jgi:hypothetical protein
VSELQKAVGVTLDQVSRYVAKFPGKEAYIFPHMYIILVDHFRNNEFSLTENYLIWVGKKVYLLPEL